MNPYDARTVGALRASGYQTTSVRSELRRNLIARLRDGSPLFPGIVGYDETVVPQIINALLSRHDFILLGLRGQAKSRILRQLQELLDPAIPILAGSEVNDDPFSPISRFGRLLLEDAGDEAPIEWISQDQRYIEKLATPDVTIADMIGELDPIRAARGGHVLADELTIHFGMLPRANRGVFAINELPDLAGRIQVGLFNVLQEGDVQIKGYPVRLPLDVLMVFTANPEDYTARGKIITPLKDRIGAEIRTHYPHHVDTGVEITRQQAWVDRAGLPILVPSLVSEVVERVAFLARRDKRIDQRSGVSQRMPITVLEAVVSNAERRSLRLGEEEACPRISDIYAALPSITGKLELEYEGELQGAEKIAEELISRAALETFEDRSHHADPDPMLDSVVEYFEEGGALQLASDAAATAVVQGFETVPGLLEAVEACQLADTSGSPGAVAAACELVLEALVGEKRVTRTGDAYARARKERKRPPSGLEGMDGFQGLG
jgi:magnesium chelatase subunit I